MDARRGGIASPLDGIGGVDLGGRSGGREMIGTRNDLFWRESGGGGGFYLVTGS